MNVIDFREGRPSYGAHLAMKVFTVDDIIDLVSLTSERIG